MNLLRKTESLLENIKGARKTAHYLERCEKYRLKPTELTRMYLAGNLVGIIQQQTTKYLFMFSVTRRKDIIMALAEHEDNSLSLVTWYPRSAKRRMKDEGERR